MCPATMVDLVLEEMHEEAVASFGLHPRATIDPRDAAKEVREKGTFTYLDSDAKTDVDQALRAAMARESERAPIFETLLTKYSLATGPAFTWVD